MKRKVELELVERINYVITPSDSRGPQVTQRAGVPRSSWVSTIITLFNNFYCRRNFDSDGYGHINQERTDIQDPTTVTKYTAFGLGINRECRVQSAECRTA
ncbi:hypothetical protein NE237_022199 [Protea cynaroides]|uniref:Uncharacterized protein n=1 Tax=Protea cynaroides TaxID=273540 RepID=A0A9Q0HCR0_9MAGN|nr:hypothetical protein NE237_022199 [Protea cynaroides]